MNTVTIDDVREYWDRRPCNVRHSTAPVGSEEWSQQVMSRKYFVEPHIIEFAKFPQWCGKKVYEMGCGIGTDTLSFLEAGARVDAVDISEESLNLAIQRTEKYWNRKLGTQPKVTFVQANIETYLPIRKYDLVYSFGVLHHTPRPELALHCANSVLKPGGELKIMLYAKYSWKNLFTRQQPEAQGGCPLATTYSVREAKELVHKAGFRNVHVEKKHIFMYSVKDYVKHEYKLAFPWSIVNPAKVEKYLGWHLLISAVKPLGWKYQ